MAKRTRAKKPSQKTLRHRGKLDTYDELPRSRRKPQVVMPAAPYDAAGMFLGPAGYAVAGTALAALVIFAVVIAR